MEGELQGEARQSRPEEERLPRKWNTSLLPGFQVIAVDERDLRNPDCIPYDKLPQYPEPGELLNDPQYVRFQRLKLELLQYRFFGSRTPIAMAGGLLDLTEDDVTSQAALDRLLAIRADYLSNPCALVDKLS